MSSISVTIGRFLRAVHAGKVHYADRSGLDAGGGYLLTELAIHGEARLTALAERAGVDPALVSRQTHSLLERGLLERIPDPVDGRASLLRLTSAGRDFVATADEFKCKFFDQVFADWEEPDRQQFEAMLERFTDDFTTTMNRLHKAKEGKKA